MPTDYLLSMSTAPTPVPQVPLQRIPRPVRAVRFADQPTMDYTPDSLEGVRVDHLLGDVSMTYKQLSQVLTAQGWSPGMIMERWKGLYPQGHPKAPSVRSTFAEVDTTNRMSSAASKAPPTENTPCEYGLP